MRTRAAALGLCVACAAASLEHLTGIPDDVLSSQELQGHDLSKAESTLSADGMSGTLRIPLADDAAEGPQPVDDTHNAPGKWSPRFTATDIDFEYIVRHEELLMVYFFSSAPEQMAKSYRLGLELERAAARLAEHEYQLACRQLDIHLYPGIAASYGVHKPHTYLFFRDGAAREYPGMRDQQSLVDYMLARAAPPTRRAENVAELDAVLAAATDVLEPATAFLLSAPSYIGQSSVRGASAGHNAAARRRKALSGRHDAKVRSS